MISDTMEIAERIKRESAERLHRIVIDEKLPNGSFRILVARMKPGAEKKNFLDLETWEEEEEYLWHPGLFSDLFHTEKPVKIAEGQVFRVDRGRAANKHKAVREHIKQRTKVLLEREGMPSVETSDRSG